MVRHEIKEVLYDLLKEKRITFSDFDVDPEVAEEMVKQGIAVKVGESGDYYDYVLVPQELPTALIDAMRKTYKAILAVVNDASVADKVLAVMMYDEVAGGLEFLGAKDGEIAWVFAKLFKRLKIEPDEVVDKYDYRHRYAGPVYRRYGETWICEFWDYCNTNRFGTIHGVFKGVTYSLEPPNSDST